VASLIGVQDRVSYEGHAAVRLEELASSVAATGTYPFDIVADLKGPWVIDTRPIILSIARDVNSGIKKSHMARRFHSTLVHIVSEICLRVMKATGICNVVLSGGTFMNELLTLEVSDRLISQGFCVYRHRLVPPNDGGLCLGQLTIAASRMNSSR
jgi:hydrogenase maturation protein HypF